MSLQDHVRAFTNDDVDYIRVGGTKIAVDGNSTAAMACHNATFIWLYRAAHGAFPSLDNLLGGAPQQLVNNLIRHGNATRVTMGRGPLPDDVLLFADPGLPHFARHSCVVVDNGRQIAGYNQAGWFDNGIADDYTEHDVGSFDWAARSCCWSTPRRAANNNREYYVWAVRGATAVGLVS